MSMDLASKARRLAAGRGAACLPQPFGDPSLEAAFLSACCRSLAPHRRFGLLLALIGWAALAALEMAMVLLDARSGPIHPVHMALRAAGAAGLLVLITLSRRPAFAQDERFATRVMLVGGGGWLLLWGLCVGVAPLAGSGLSGLAGLLLIMAVGSGPLHLRAGPAFGWLLACSLGGLFLLVGPWATGAWPAPGLEHLMPWLPGLLLGFVALAGAVACAQREWMARTWFQSSLAPPSVADRSPEPQAAKGQAAAGSAAAQADVRRQRALPVASPVGGLVPSQSALEPPGREASSYLAAAVHDLRQPMQVIGNALDPLTLALQSGRTEDAIQMVGLARQAVAVMRHQLSSIMDLSRLESGQVKVQVEACSLTELVDELMATFRPAALAASAALTLENLVARDLTVRTDPRLLRQIVSNLLSNAIKHQDRRRRVGHRVSVIMMADGRHAVLQLVDNGAGIPQDSIASGDLFKPFHRAAAQRDGDPGAGLGLAIVKAMTALLPDHDLQVSSTVGEGSSFSLTLPLSQGAAWSSAEAPWLEPEGLEPEGLDLEHLYVILVEADALVRRATITMLEARKVLVDSTDSVDGLLRLIHELERVPDVLVCDYRLSSGETVVDVAELIHDRVGPISVIVFSDETPHLSSIEALHRVQVLRKPVSSQQLLNALAQSRWPPTGPGSGDPAAPHRPPPRLPG
jgi:signal transduction histidine kinase